MEASHARMSEPEILAARDWAEEKAGETELAAFSDEHAALVRRAETLLNGGSLEDDDHKSLSDLLARIQDTRAGRKASAPSEHTIPPFSMNKARLKTSDSPTLL